MQRRNRGADNLGVILLVQHLLFTIGLENIPPVTLGTIGFQIAVFLGFLKVPWRTLQECCVSAYAITEHHEYGRLLSSVIEHSDSMHLYYNMASFAWKGIILESVVGAPFFAYMLVVFSVLCGLVYVAIYYLLAVLITPDFMFSCAVGFSGVIFALKVVVNRLYPEVHPTIGGFQMRIPGGMYIWLELVLLSLITPGTSFVGHLAGILVGLAYCAGFLHPIFDLFGIVTGYNPHRQWASRAARGGSSGSQYTRQSDRNRTGYERTYNFFQVPAMPQLLTPLLMLLLAAVHFKDYLPTEAGRLLYAYVGQKCLNSYLVLDTARYAALITAALHTLGRLHLAYVLLTLFKVGGNIERRLGTLLFGALVALLTVGSGLVYVGLVRYVLVHAESVAGVYPYDMKYKCFMGPTALLLALKVMHAHLFPYANASWLLLELPGIPFVLVTTLEILVLHTLFPQAWFIGNIAGVLAGLFCVLLMKATT